MKETQKNIYNASVDFISVCRGSFWQCIADIDDVAKFVLVASLAELIRDSVQSKQLDPRCAARALLPADPNLPLDAIDAIPVLGILQSRAIDIDSWPMTDEDVVCAWDEIDQMLTELADRARQLAA